MKPLRWMTVATVMTATAALTPAIASAHDWVVATTPAESSTGPSPTQVSITYNEAVKNPQIWVTGPDHAEWTTGPLKGSGASYSVALRPSPIPGEYIVHWHNTSADGDEVHSQWSFTVG
ncbi:copper resistance protein CopC [Mycolicibacterium mucogenicum]|uniref:copper resistance CopC family protein n=1 Tax=Mycolicibacterium mucogenicum TaxID=56689 RepID=UPI00226A43F7|nr:copper resistance CopC family protein [Mycolicibacterium mucogenicum]MCX8554944.1 copper resistance protein CopC [Mycolicibacterium mucogenicum]